MIEGVREHLIEAVKLRLRADVPVGIYLSGGKLAIFYLKMPHQS